MFLVTSWLKRPVSLPTCSLADEKGESCLRTSKGQLGIKGDPVEDIATNWPVRKVAKRLHKQHRSIGGPSESLKTRVGKKPESKLRRK